jgi:hypothetical protein
VPQMMMKAKLRSRVCKGFSQSENTRLV